MPERDVCLSVVFNHRYDKNLAALDRIYRGRFSDVHYLMPFYDGPRADVIPVYYSSYNFQGFFAQAYDRLAARGAKYYAFVADDMLLNPRLDESNLVRELRLDEHSAYIKNVHSLDDRVLYWEHTLPALLAFKRTGYVHFHKELPPPEEALRLVRRHGIEPKAVSKVRLLRSMFRHHRTSSISLLLHYILFHHGRRTPQYPLLTGWSDLIVVPGRFLANFCRLCGVFAAMGLCCEVAVPTALGFTCDRLVREQDTGWHGSELWIKGEIDAIFERADLSTEKMLAALGERQLYVHPVKLSRLTQ